MGERSPCPAGWGTQPLRTVCDNTTLRSSGARGLDVSRCYRHIAPLERKAAMHRNSRYCIHRGGEVTLPSGLGDPTPTDPTSVAHLPIFVPPVFRLTCCSAGGKCGTIGGAVSIVGSGLLAQRVGEPNPYAYNFACSPSNFCASRLTCRPSGALGCLVCGVFYKHAAPLGLKIATPSFLLFSV